jgi:hypothetical protein
MQLQDLDGVHHQCSSGGTLASEKNESDVALTAFWRIFGILRGLDVRPDVGHRETLVLFAGT